MRSLEGKHRGVVVLSIRELWRLVACVRAGAPPAGGAPSRTQQGAHSGSEGSGTLCQDSLQQWVTERPSMEGKDRAIVRLPPCLGRGREALPHMGPCSLSLGGGVAVMRRSAKAGGTSTVQTHAACGLGQGGGGEVPGKQMHCFGVQFPEVETKATGTATPASACRLSSGSRCCRCPLGVSRVEGVASEAGDTLGAVGAGELHPGQ